MIGIILCGSLETKLEQELAALDPDDPLSPLAGVPRALLPINGVAILDRWLSILREHQSVTEIFLVSNGLRYKFFERWATGHGLGVEHVVNNGCTSTAASLGAVNDLRLGLERARFLRQQRRPAATAAASGGGGSEQSDVMVIGADHLFHCGFSLDGFLRFYNSRRGAHPDRSFCFCYKVAAAAAPSLGIIRADGPGQTASRFWEKPKPSSVRAAAFVRKQDDAVGGGGGGGGALAAGAAGGGASGDGDGSITACPCFYVLRPSAVPFIHAFLADQRRQHVLRPSMGHLMEFLINSPDDDDERGRSKQEGEHSRGARGSAAGDTDDGSGGDVAAAATPVAAGGARHGFFVMRLPSGFQLIGGSIGLADYRRLNDTFHAWEGDGAGGAGGGLGGLAGGSAFGGLANREFVEVIKVKSFARVGLLGNPSDGFNGRTIAATVSNYFAEITIFESRKLHLIPHPLYDPHSFSSLGALFEIGHREGYQGGLRLLMATCKKFFEFCYDQGVSLPKRNFTVKYDTNIPRQVGLAGSSAIVSALVKALMEFFRLDDSDIKQALQPNLILNVEVDELHINAGLQDRVVQVYGGVVCMDFSKALMERQGHGDYERLGLDLAALPPLWLAFVADPSDSGRMHSNVRQRWVDGDPAVVEGMAKFAEYTVQGKKALLAGDFARFMELMDENFNLRKSLYGEPALGPANLEMISIARSAGSACKFPGSGGAIVGMCTEDKMSVLRQRFEAQGFVFVRLAPFAPSDAERVSRVQVRSAAMGNAHFLSAQSPGV